MPDEKYGKDPTTNPDSDPFLLSAWQAAIEQRVVTLESQNDPPKNRTVGDDLTKKIKPGERLLIGINGAAVFVSILILVVYIHQLGEMTKATISSAKAAYASCLSAKIARSTLLEVQAGGIDNHNLAAGSILQAAAVTRAEAAQVELDFSGVKASILPPASIMFPMEVENAGKSAAQRVQIQSVVRILKAGTEPDFSYPSTPMNQEKIGAFFPNDHHKFIVGLAVPRDGSADARFDRPMNSTEAAGYRTGELYVSEYTRITYTDIFGVSHWLRHCEYSESGRGRAHMYRYKKCGAYNGTDTNEVKVAAIGIPSSPTIPDPDPIVCKEPKE